VPNDCLVAETLTADRPTSNDCGSQVRPAGTIAWDRPPARDLNGAPYVPASRPARAPAPIPRRAPQSWFDEALAQAGDGVVAIDADGRIGAWNRAAEKMLGYTALQATGRRCWEIFAGQDCDGNKRCYENCPVMTLLNIGESVQNFDLRTRTKDGRPVWINLSVLHMSPGANGHEGQDQASARSGSRTLHIFRDVTTTKDLLARAHERSNTPSRDGEDSEPLPSLTRRQLDVLRLITQGVNTKGLADQLHVTQATVRNHVQSIMETLGVHSRLEAVAYATRHRLF
jgi:PAS domain S-box-containing protein